MNFFSAFRRQETQFFEVEELSPEALATLTVVAEEQGLKLYRDKGVHQAVLRSAHDESKCFSLFRIVPEAEARAWFNKFHSKLALNLDLFGKECLEVARLQDLCDAIRFHDDYTLAHLAACLGTPSLFKIEAVRNLVNEETKDSKESALFIAVERGNVELLKVLLECGASLDQVDAKGNCIYHLAAGCKNSEIIRILGSKDKSKINFVNKKGQTPLHEACSKDLSDNVMELLNLGANACTTEHHTYPIHHALKNDSLRAVDLLCKAKKCQANRTDKDNQDSPLHWAKSKEALVLLLKMGAELEKKNSKGETALMKKVKEGSFSEVVTCLYKGADVDCIDNDNNTPLMVAIMNDNHHLVKLLLAFGADVNLACKDQDLMVTPRHRAAASNGKNKETILAYLHSAGAERCEAGMKDCNSGCSNRGSNNGKVNKSVDHSHPTCDDDLTMEALRALWTHCDNEALKKAEERCAMREEVEEVEGVKGEERKDGVKKDAPGLRILTINAGRLEGLAILRSLMHLERACERPIKECFDYIGGSGSGAFIALAIMQDKPIRTIFNLYLELCQEVLYSDKGGEECTEREFDARLKAIFGENRKMFECTGARVVTTACRYDDRPLKKVLCRNYEIPGANVSSRRKVETYMKASDVLCWRACKWSGFADAGLTSSSKTFVDGCLLGADPTMDVLLEIHHANAAAVKNGGVERPVHLVVSMGAECSLMGLEESSKVEGMEKMDEEKRKEVLGRLLLEYSQHTDSHQAMQAKSWCHMVGAPLIRFYPNTPSLPPAREVLNDPVCLGSYIWEVEMYLREQSKRFQKVASLLC